MQEVQELVQKWRWHNWYFQYSFCSTLMYWWRKPKLSCWKLSLDFSSHLISLADFLNQGLPVVIERRRSGKSSTGSNWSNLMKLKHWKMRLESKSNWIEYCFVVHQRSNWDSWIYCRQRSYFQRQERFNKWMCIGKCYYTMQTNCCKRCIVQMNWQQYTLGSHQRLDHFEVAV